MHDPTAVIGEGGAGRRDWLGVPRSGLEGVGRRGERAHRADLHGVAAEVVGEGVVGERVDLCLVAPLLEVDEGVAGDVLREAGAEVAEDAALAVEGDEVRSEEHTSELQSLMRKSYAVFCLKKKNINNTQ